MIVNELIASGGGSDYAKKIFPLFGWRNQTAVSLDYQRDPLANYRGVYVGRDVQSSFVLEQSQEFYFLSKRKAVIVANTSTSISNTAIENAKNSYETDGILLEPCTTYRLHIYTRGNGSSSYAYWEIYKCDNVASNKWERLKTEYFQNVAEGNSYYAHLVAWEE